MSKFSIPKKPEYKLSEEAAVEQIVAMLAYYDYDIDAIEDADERKSAEDTLNKLVRFIRLGKVEIMTDHDPPYAVQYAGDDVVEYKGSINKAKSAMDGYARDARYSMLKAFMGSLSGLGKGGVDRMDGKDLQVMEVLANFLSTLVS